MLVLAGPGSGKTLVITRRIKKLIEEYGVNPSNILVVTFTKAAALEMEERFIKLSGGQKMPVNFGTFHAVYFKILKYAYNYNAGNILREEVKREYIKEIIDKTGLEIDDENDFLQNIISEISMVKGEMISLEHYYSKNCPEDIFKQIYHAYADKLNKVNGIDFDDMLIMCYELLNARRDILQIWQKKYQYILIDEFQDVSRVQYEIMKMIAEPLNNLFVVGDDDQSIYRFRGAKPEIMLNFQKDYKGASRILLDTNYRCGAQIVGASLSLIKNNKARFPKNIKPLHPTGEKIEFGNFADVKRQNQNISKTIKDYLANGIRPEEIAILFRTNTGARNVIEKLMENNIPFHIKDGIPNIYDHWIAKNILTYIRIALGDTTRGSFLQIMNKPKRYISREALSHAQVDLAGLKSYYRDKVWMVERIEKLEYDLSLLAGMNPYSAVNYIRHGIGYEEYLIEYAKFRRLKPEELFDLLEEIQESAKDHKTFSEWFLHIEEYAEKLKKDREKRNFEHNSVGISTMHSAKGLEYKIVFIPDANEGVTPHGKAVIDEDIEEERRLFYVAMTRAKERLHIYSVKEKYNKELKVSRFVGELLCDFEQLEAGKKIYHKKYGAGNIKKNLNGKLEIYFPNLKKTLVFDAKYAVANNILRLPNHDFL